MKTYTKLVLLAFVFIYACITPKKLLERGQYDAAITKAIEKVRRKHKTEDIITLSKAYHKANEQDISRINFLRKDGSPDCWDDVYEIYTRLKNRQDRIKPLLPLTAGGKSSEQLFPQVNYDEEIISAKKKAAEYLYSHAMDLLQKNDRYEARRAHGELMRVKSFYPNYKDVDEQLKKARAIGITYVIFKMQNKTGWPLPPAFEQELTKISLSDLNREWIVYHTNEKNDVHYNYIIWVNMKVIDVGPERMDRNKYTETKEVPDGFQYVLDAKGNVMKDSLGNDIKKPKTKVISCNIVENIQQKRAVITGTLDWVRTDNTQLIRTDPIIAENIFEHRWAIASGDINALKPETKAKLNSTPVPFPPSPDMVLQAGQTLKNMVKDVIWNNKYLLN